MARTPAVLLISPGIIKWTDMDFGLPHMVAMGGYLMEHTGVRVELLDLNYEGGDQHQLARTLEQLGPYLCIGVSCFSSFDYMRVMSLGRFLKAAYPDVPLVTGGYHASALPKDLVFPGSPFDAAVVGEGERPMREIVETLLGQGRLKQQYGPDNVQDLDTLPPYRWELLHRYWPRATDIGRKFQIYLSRGCPYRCAFCMERAKTEYKWRAYSSGRAVEELERLSTFTDLSHWVINLADPLFGFRRRWRREVLQGIIDKGLLPRQYWTLTRSDDLGEEDVSLLARARFSIGIGLESGSPDMLVTMNKGNKPEAYLEAMMRLARLSRDHGLNWASNVIVGHPGETFESMRETQRYLTELFTSAKETCGWLSIDPFRLYPGAYIHEAMPQIEQKYGTRFYHKEWWKSWYDGPFRAEHLDPSHEVDFEARVRFMYEAYPPLVAQIAERFRGQGRSVDRVFQRSLDEQANQMSDQVRDQVLARGVRAKKELLRKRPEGVAVVLALPIGLHVKDAWVRKRELAVRRLLERGILRTDTLIEAFLQTAPERFMADNVAESLLGGRTSAPETEGDPPLALSIDITAMALEALEPAPGDKILVAADFGYVTTILAQLVGDAGRVILVSSASWLARRKLSQTLMELKQVKVMAGDLTVAPERDFDRMFIGGALPLFPASLANGLLNPAGRAVTFLGPRFRPQDLVCLVRRGKEVDERRIARIKVPVLRGASGWLRPSA